MWSLLLATLTAAAAVRDPTYGQTALASAEGNVKVAEAAAQETAADQVEASASQQLVIAQAEEGRASTAFDTNKPFLPEAHAADTQASIAARKAAEEASRAKAAEAEMKKVAQEAADKAGQMVMDMIKADAAAEAKKAADKAADWKSHKADRLAANAAAAMEPFHLAQLREQKISASDHAKGVSAMEAAKKMAADGQKMAADAQNLQAAGLIYQANQLMQEAHSAMSGAESLQKNAQALYTSASEAGARAGYYVYAAQQAAAAATSIVGTLFNKPPAFPSFLQRSLQRA